MFENLKVKGLIMNARLVELKDDEKGESTKLTEINYLIPQPMTDTFAGGALFVGYSNGNAFELIKTKTLRLFELEIEKRPLRNKNGLNIGDKYYIISIDGQKLK